jgi:hypothetical protein
MRVVVPSVADHRVRVRRRRRVVPAVLVAGFLLVIGALVAIDVIAVNTGTPASIIFPYEQMADQLRSNHWSDVPILAVAAFVTALGALLIAFAVAPARKGRTPVAADDPEVTASVSARSLRRACAAAAVGVPGVSKVRVAHRRRSVRVRADSRLRDPAGLAEQVAMRVGEKLRAIGPARRTVVRVRVRKRGD